jgi:hypothetical protein
MPIRIRPSDWTTIDLEDSGTWPPFKSKVYIKDFFDCLECERCASFEVPHYPQWSFPSYTVPVETGQMYMTKEKLSDIYRAIPKNEFTLYDPENIKTWPKEGKRLFLHVHDPNGNPLFWKCGFVRGRYNHWNIDENCCGPPARWGHRWMYYIIEYIKGEDKD